MLKEHSVGTLAHHRQWACKPLCTPRTSHLCLLILVKIPPVRRLSYENPILGEGLLLGMNCPLAQLGWLSLCVCRIKQIQRILVILETKRNGRL